jgi:hypothetical protein
LGTKTILRHGLALLHHFIKKMAQLRQEIQKNLFPTRAQPQRKKGLAKVVHIFT